MVKILAIGDFHGEFPSKLERIAKGVDLVVSVGDYCPFSYRRIWFKHCYKTDTELWEILGKEKMKKLIKKDLKKGEEILKKLNKLPVPVISITGNLDYTRWYDAIDSKKPKWNWPYQNFFSKIVKKCSNIKIFDYSSVKINNIRFIGMATSTFPGRVKSKSYKRLRKKLDKLFLKYKGGNIVFVSHNVPYKTKLSKISSKDVPKEYQGEEKGSKLVRRIIERYQPLLNLCGHMHEHQCRDRIGKTPIINVGPAYKGKAAVIEFDEENGKVEKAKFIK